jgi:peptidoglycan hydrolase-like protein with peptidoglycan-binding domain
MIGVSIYLRRIGRTVVAFVIGLAGSIVFLAEPAAAATPVCTSYRRVSGYYSPTSGSGSRTCWMQRGHRGDGVMVLQMILHDCYGAYLDGIGFPYEIAIDSDFGPITQRALQEVQYIEQITDDGVYGPETAYSIMQLGDGKPCAYR